MTLEAEIRQLEVELELHVAAILDAARTAVRHRERWAALRRAWVGEEVEGHPCRSGEGARPDEVREVLRALVGNFEGRLDALRARLTDAQDAHAEHLDDVLWELRYRRLSRLVDETLSTYIRDIASPLGVAGVFANASASTASRRMPAAVRDDPTVYTVLCRGCGSPRRENEHYEACRYCGNTFFAPAESSNRKEKS